MPVVDCDIHPAVPSIKALLPFMSDYWREQFVNRGIDGLDLGSYPPQVPLSCRPDWRPASGLSGADIDLVSAHALAGLGSDIAICNSLSGGLSAFSPHMAVAVCSAVNDWMRAEWLDRDPRLRASIIIPAQDPIAAAAEIDRCAGDRRFVQVLMLVSNELLLGRSFYWPIYETAARLGLPVGIHAGSMHRHPTTPVGWPSHYLQDYASAPQMFSAQLQSLMSEGVFDRFPELIFVLIESGVAWITPYMWRAAKTWHGIRGEVPWMRRSPIDYVRSQVRLTIQPFDGPESSAQLERFVDQLGSDELLLFASDYPHWHFEGSDPMPVGFSDALTRKIKTVNPLRTYPRLEEVR